MTAHGASLITAGSPRPGRWPAQFPQLLPADGRPAGLPAHLALHGPLPYRGGPGRLIADAAESGLTGRGGAAFPASWPRPLRPAASRSSGPTARRASR